MWGTHEFARLYQPMPDWGTYEALTDLVGEMRRRTADLGPADNIDLQSFLWVVIDYTKEDVA